MVCARSIANLDHIIGLIEDPFEEKLRDVMTIYEQLSMHTMDNSTKEYLKNNHGQTLWITGIKDIRSDMQNI